MIVAGVPMHIMGIVGRSSGILYAISALMWLMTVVLFVLYMTRRMSLKIAISTFGLLIQLTGSARIVYMAIERPEGFDQTILFNQIISLALIIYLVMAVVRHIPTIIATISIATIVFAYLYTDGGFNKQIVVIFVLVEMFTCVLGEMIRRGIRDMQCENADYHTTINRVLATFHMNKNRTACLYTTGTRRAERQGHYRLLRPSRRAHRSQPYQGCGAANGSSTNATCQYFICVALVDAYRAGGMPIDYRWQDYI